MEKQEMKRPHFLVILLLSLIVVCFTLFLSPFSQEGEGVVERGWPVGWVSFPTYTEIPIIGPLLFLMLPDTVQLIWSGFLFDLAFFSGIFWAIVIFTTRRKIR